MSNLNHITITQKDQKAGTNHFKLRDYDARLARWTTIDPYNQYHSPYLAMGNNPISKIDPDGGMATGGGYNSDAEMSLKQKIRELQLRSARMYEDGGGLHGGGAHSGGGGGVSGASGYNIDGLNVSASMGSMLMRNDAFITNVNTYNGVHFNLFGYSGAGIYKYYEATNGVQTSDVKSMRIRSFREYMFNFGYALTGVSYRTQPIDNFVYSNIEYGYASNLIVASTGGGGETPEWITNTGRGVGAFMPANTTKEVLIDYVKTTGNIGKTGAKYLKIVRGAGVTGSLIGVGVSGVNIYNDYDKNGNGFGDVNNWDVADASVGIAGLGVTSLVTIGLVSNPIGWGVAIVTGVYFGARLIYDTATDE